MKDCEICDETNQLKIIKSKSILIFEQNKRCFMIFSHLVRKLFITSQIFLMLVFNVYGQKNFKLYLEKEASIFGLSSAIVISSFLINQNQNVTLQELSSLDKNQINAFDRSAITFYSKDLSLVSDVLLISAVSLPFSFILFDDAKDELKSIGVMYLQTLSLTYGLTNFTKNLSKRYRPYAYRSDVPLEEKLDTDTKKSFFSGHTSTAFASAFFFSTVYSEITSNQKSKTLVWVGSLTLASSVGLLRYFSGKHFPTDIIAGAVVGGLVGYGIPKLHQSNNKLSISTPIASNLISVRYYIK